MKFDQVKYGTLDPFTKFLWMLHKSTEVNLTKNRFHKKHMSENID